MAAKTEEDTRGRSRGGSFSVGSDAFRVPVGIRLVRGAVFSLLGEWVRDERLGHPNRCSCVKYSGRVLGYGHSCGYILIFTTRVR